MSKPHKHADVIKAWADGKEIEAFVDGQWLPVSHPTWLEHGQYRIKPEPLEWQAEREAFARGERVQFRSTVMGSDWQDLAPGHHVAWDLPFAEFRIPHKWQKEMDAWARGEAVEVRDDNGIDGPLASLASVVGRSWAEIDRSITPNPMWLTVRGREYRIKPKTETHKIRVALMQCTSSSAPFTRTVATYSEATTVERQAAFVRWLCEWQEVEVELKPKLDQGGASDGGVAAVKKALEDCAKFGAGGFQVGFDLGRPGGDESAFFFRRVHVNK